MMNHPRYWSNRMVPWLWNGILNTQVMYLVEMLAGPMHAYCIKGWSWDAMKEEKGTNYWERGQCATRGTHHGEALRDTDTILPFLAYQAWCMSPVMFGDLISLPRHSYGGIGLCGDGAL
jgi:hypothetical protein